MITVSQGGRLGQWVSLAPGTRGSRPPLTAPQDPSAALRALVSLRGYGLAGGRFERPSLDPSYSKDSGW
jgi:hypothetical protein